MQTLIAGQTDLRFDDISLKTLMMLQFKRREWRAMAGMPETLLLTCAAVWGGLVLATPLIGVDALYGLFHLVCHQDTARSWWLFEAPLPICIRCTSIYVGFLFSLLARPEANRKWLILSLASGLGELLTAHLIIDSAVLRCLTGLAIGATTAPFVSQGFTQMWRRRVSV
jgi:uncharacterized membrane protein